MITATKLQIGNEGVSQTKIVYSKAQIMGTPEILNKGRPLRIVFTKDNVNLVNVADTMLCFSLSITPPQIQQAVGTLGPRYPLVLTDGASNLFQVQSIYWGGIQMNMLHQIQTGALYNSVRKHLTGRKSMLTDGRVRDDIKYPYVTEANLVAPYCSTDKTLLAEIKNSQSDSVAYRERQRLSSEVQKYYNVVEEAKGNGKIAGTNYRKKTTYNQTYSVRLGDIAPELNNLGAVSPAMFQGSGLEINLLLVDPSVAFCIPPMNVYQYTLPSAPGDAADTGVAGTPTRDPSQENYEISNIFLSLVYYESINPKFGIYNDISFTSIYHKSTSVRTTGINDVFNLNSSCFVKGLIVMVTANSQQSQPSFISEQYNGTTTATQTADSAQMGGILGMKGSAGGQGVDLGIKGLNTMSILCGHYLQYIDNYITVGSVQIPVNQSPPVSEKQLFTYLLAQHQSEQIFGASYENNLDKFIYTDFVQFFPVNMYVPQGQLITVQLTFKDIDASVANALSAQIMVVCDRVISADSSGTMKITS